jgi:flagellar operon protein
MTDLESLPINSTITPLSGPEPAARVSQVNKQSEGTSFADLLQEAQGLKFSKHAQSRMQNRQITLDDDGLNRLAEAVAKAEKRGGRESLVLMDDLAFIVNVREKTVVTAIEAKDQRSEGVFTQIDSVVLAHSSDKTRGE